MDQDIILQMANDAIAKRSQRTPYAPTTTEIELGNFMALAGPNAEDETYKALSSAIMQRFTGIEAGQIYRNFDAAAETWAGAIRPPRDIFEKTALAWNTGILASKLGDATNAWADARMRGDDLSPYEKQISDIKKQMPLPQEYKNIFPRGFFGATTQLAQMLSSGLGTLKRGAGLSTTTRYTPIDGEQKIPGMIDERMPDIGSSAILIAALGPIGALIGQQGYSAYKTEGGLALDEMLSWKDENGASVDPDAAVAMSTGIGLLNGAIEIAQDLTIPGIGNVPKEMLKESAKAAFSKITRNAFLRKPLIEASQTIAAQSLRGALKYMTSEISQEIIQETITAYGEEIAKEISNRTDGTSLAHASTKEIAQRLIDTGIESALVFGFLGLPGGSMNIASQTARKQINQQIAQEDAAAGMAEAIIQEFAPEQAAAGRDAVRTEKGEVYTEVQAGETTQEGQGVAIVYAGDKNTGERYGYLRYRTDGERVIIEDAALEEDSLDPREVSEEDMASTALPLKDAQDVRRALIREAAAQNPGMELVYESPTPAMAAALEAETADNPRGREYGPQRYGTDGQEREFIDNMAAFKTKMARVFKNVQQGGIDLMAELTARRAQRVGLTPEAYVRQRFAGFTSLAPAAVGQAQLEGKTVNGSTVFRDGRAIIYAAEKADFRTLSHEMLHAWMNEIEETAGVDGDALKKAFGVQEWTRDDRERVAYSFEKYLESGTAENDAIKTILQKVVEWMVSVYNTMAKGMTISPEIRATFDELFAKPESPVAQASAKSAVVEATPEAELELFQEAGNINSKEFKEWFGDSKVVDKNGNPLVVYHGAPDARGIVGEEGRFKSENERMGLGRTSHVHWFTDSLATAKTYADDHRAFDYQNAEARIIPAYLKIENPLIIDGDGREWREAQAIGKTSDVIEKAQAEGYDGLIINNVKDDYNNGKNTRPVSTYAVFSPTQVKSTNNRGTWDANDPRIMFQEAYHGTPHRFESFTTGKIGAGEGAQAYGWGLYFAGDKEVAKWYKSKLERFNDEIMIDGNVVSGDDYYKMSDVDQIIFRAWNGNPAGSRSLKELVKQLKAEKKGAFKEWKERYQQAIEKASSEAVSIKTNPGQLFRVSIPDDSEYMDWDEPIDNEINAILRDELEKRYGETPDATGHTWGLGENQDGFTFDDENFGRDVYREIVRATGSEKEASLLMKEAGIPGIKYFDGTTRSKAYTVILKIKEADIEEYASQQFSKKSQAESYAKDKREEGFFVEVKENGNRNYVIFDERDVQIEEAYYQLTEPELSDAAAQAQTWEEFKAIVEGDEADTTEGLTEEEKDFWYQATFERLKAGEASNKTLTPQEADEAFVEEIPENLDGFLAAIYDSLTTNWSQETPSDAAEAAALESRMADETRLRNQIHLTVKTAALRVGRGDELTRRQRASVLTLMRKEGARTFYRRWYGKLVGNEALTVDAQADETYSPSIERLDFEGPAVSIEDRLKIMRKMKDEDLRKRLASGDIVPDKEIGEYLENREAEIKTLEADLATKESSLKEKIDELKPHLKRERTREKWRQELVKKIREQGDAIVKGVNEGTIDERMVMERNKNKAFLKEIESQGASHAEVSEIAETFAIEEAIADTKAHLKEIQDKKKSALQIRNLKIGLGDAIMRKIPKGVSFERAKEIQAIQALVDPYFRRASVKWNGELFDMKFLRENVDTLKDSGFPAELAARLEKKNLGEWTIRELEELAQEVKELVRLGKAERDFEIQRWKAERQREASAVITSAMSAGKYKEPEAAGSVERKQQMEKKDNIAKRIALSTINARRVATMIDGGTDGQNVRELINERRTVYAEKMAQADRRIAKVHTKMKELGIKEKALYDKKVTIEGVGPDGRAATFTKSDLMYIYLGLRDENTKAAILYGNLFSMRERGNSDRQLIEALGRERMTKLQAEIMTALTTEEMALAEEIGQDFKDEFGRMNEVFIKEFNYAMAAVESYVPIIRQDVSASGEKHEKSQAEEVLNIGGTSIKRSPEKGFAVERIKIAPEHQRATRLDLYGTWLQAVEREEHFTAYTHYIRKLNAIYKGNSTASKLVRDAIVNSQGAEAMRYVDDYINELANPQTMNGTANLDKMVRLMRGNLGGAYLGWKVSGMVKQAITSPLPYLTYVSPIAMAAASFEAISNAKDFNATIKRESQYMNHRVANPIFDAIKMAKATPGAGRAMAEFSDIGMKGLEAVDWISVSIGWKAVYNQAQAALAAGKETVALGGTEYRIVKDTVEAFDAHVYTAAEIADDITLKCQPSADPAELAPLFKTKGKGGEFARAFTQFGSALNVIWQQLSYDLPNAVKHKQIGTAVRMAGAYAVAGILMGLVTRGKEDDDDDLKDDLLYWSMTQATDSVPLISSYVSAVWYKIATEEKESIYKSPLYPALDELYNGVINLTDAEWGKAAQNFSEGLGLGLGLPVSGAKELGRMIDIGPQALVGRRE